MAGGHGGLPGLADLGPLPRGGLQDFARETPWRSPSLVLERDPPEHTRARTVLNRVLSPAAMKRLWEEFAAANRDPRRWARPDEYDIARRTSGHVGFGAGIHMCVGQLLARLEGEVLLAALARRVRAIEITDTPVRRHNNTLRGLASLPLTLHAA